MSRGGRWRRIVAGLRVGFVLALIVALGWGAWLLAGTLQAKRERMPASARTVPLRPPQLLTDGVHTTEWLRQTLALPENVTLMELDLEALRERLLADGQVLTARLTRNFPDKLIVQITERLPVARIMAEWVGRRLPLLVARDGVIFPGEGYPADLIATLPWLDGLSLSRRADGFAPVAGMESVAELLTRGRLEAEHLYRGWNVVSLARLEADREIEVRTRGGATIIFSATTDFFPQLAKLNYIWDRLLKGTDGPVRIDLSLGREVPVRAEDPAALPLPAPARAIAAPAFSISPPTPSKKQREL